MTSAAPPPAADDLLISRAREGDEAAVEELLALLRPYVLRRCRRLLPFPEDADEAAQDALLAIATHLGDYTGAGTFAGWVTTIASNSARMTYRRLRRRAAEHGAETLPERPDPRTTSVMAGTRVDLLEALAELEEARPQTVEAFVLRDVGSLPYEDIAALTGVSVAAARERIHTARQFVRERLITRM